MIFSGDFPIFDWKFGSLPVIEPTSYRTSPWQFFSSICVANSNCALSCCNLSSFSNRSCSRLSSFFLAYTRRPFDVFALTTSPIESRPNKEILREVVTKGGGLLFGLPSEEEEDA